MVTDHIHIVLLTCHQGLFLALHTQQQDCTSCWVGQQVVGVGLVCGSSVAGVEEQEGEADQQLLQADLLLV